VSLKILATLTLRWKPQKLTVSSLEEGAIVHFCGRDEKALFAAHEYFAALQGAPKTARADGRKIDVTVPHEVDAWINDIFEIEKRIDVVVSNVSSISVTNDAAAWQTAYQTDMMGTVALINSALPYLERSKGSIVTISSVSGRDVDFTAPSPYGAFKAALSKQPFLRPSVPPLPFSILPHQ
jgi:3-oxoacyl-[acyl-carrier protein] reductase